MGQDRVLTIPARRRIARRADWMLYIAVPTLTVAVVVASPSASTPASWVAAAGLAALAVTDATERRVPVGSVRLLAGLTGAAMLSNSLWTGSWSDPTRALVAVSLATVAVGTLWFAMPGAIAFGDVKVTVIAVAAAAAASWTAVAMMIGVACVTGGLIAVVMRKVRRHLTPISQPTIPFLPGLALGFLVGLMWS